MDEELDRPRDATPEGLPQVDERLRVIVDAMSAAVTLCSRDLRYLWVSKTYAAWLGRRVSEVVGQPIDQVMGADALAAIRTHIDDVLSGKRVQYEDRIPVRGLGVRWIQATY